jgi:hypothetical protein
MYCLCINTKCLPEEKFVASLFSVNFSTEVFIFSFFCDFSGERPGPVFSGEGATTTFYCVVRKLVREAQIQSHVHVVILNIVIVILVVLLVIICVIQGVLAQGLRLATKQVRIPCRIFFVICKIVNLFYSDRNERLLFGLI